MRDHYYTYKKKHKIKTGRFLIRSGCMCYRGNSFVLNAFYAVNESDRDPSLPGDATLVYKACLRFKSCNTAEDLDLD